MSSPFLDLPGAVPGEGATADVALHYGSFFAEQRALLAGDGVQDRADLAVLQISGPDRLALLHALTTQFFEGLAAQQWTSALVLSPQGHVQLAFVGFDDGESFWACAEPEQAQGLAAFLDRMKFMMRVEVALRPDRFLVEVAGTSHILDESGRRQLAAALPGEPVGLWAAEAVRIAAGRPRYGVDTDHKTIPNEVGLGDAVHLDKGCYRGQETVARVHNLGKPPRRLTKLHLDGSESRLPEVGSPVELASQPGQVVGRMGSSARHWEEGPIGLALLKRNVPVEATLIVDGMSASQEIVVDPDVGLHVRNRLDR